MNRLERDRSRWITIIFSLVMLAGIVLLLTAISELVELIIVAALLAYVIDPLAVFLESRGMSRKAATALIFLSLTLFVGIFLFLLLPVLSTEIAAIRAGVKSGRHLEMISGFEKSIEGLLGFSVLADIDLSGRLNNLIVGAGNWILGHLLDVVSLVTHLVILPFIVFFLLKDGRELKKQFIRIIPNRYFEFSLNLLHKMDQQLGNYLRGQFLDAVVFGTLSVLALWIVGVKYFLLIGLFAGLANLIPFVGPLAGAVTAITVSVIDTGGFTQAGYIVIAFAVMKLIDDGFIQPVVVARTVHMHPLVVLLAVIVGGKLFGILGMLLSVPATGFIKVALQEGISSFRRYNLT